MKIFSFVAAAIIMTSTSLWAQSKPETAAELAAYSGPDREQILLEGAKKEGKIVWYTSLAGASYGRIVKAFGEKYPDVKVEVYRAGSKDLTPKILNEAQAGKFLVDAIETTPGTLMLLRDKKILLPYNSPELKRYPETAKYDAEGGNIFWVNDRESFIGFGYNTKIVAEKDVPKNYEDLLKPAWKGKMGMQLNSTGDRVIGTMLKVNGKEYLSKYQKQDVKLFKVSGAALRDLIIAGEVAGSPTIFRNHVLAKIDTGAPIKWVPMDLVPTNAGGAAVIKNGPHPHAARLFIDFLIGDGGQSILEKLHYAVAWKEYPFPRYYPERGMTTMQYIKAEKGWDKLLKQVGRNS
jgi:iron(III) transport system substrate-binding protein